MTASFKDTSVWSAANVRATFLKFFMEKHNHTFVPSSKSIPHQDPSLLFANSGMNQFKPVFLGTIDPNTPLAKVNRATNSQKCIRAGGKHNDLDDVGKDTYHHTFFEMLGNWSFGDYFKHEAIKWAWDLLTKVYKLNPDRLYVTYFGGDASQGLVADNEARDFWLQLGLPANRVVPFGCKENFWEMGDQGPCGPCSEIHYDLLDTGRFVPELVNADDPTLIEIWNLVFIQYNREPDSSLRMLPAKHVDTGMGFERLVCALQGKLSNYDTDVFTPIFVRIQQVTGARAYSGNLGALDTDGVDMAYRVVADHIRTLLVAISDGGIPSNEGRGYVLRRILRRGIRYARSGFNVPVGSFFSSIVDSVADSLGSVFPEVSRNLDSVKQILDEEEAAFAKTLDRGLKLFDTIIAKSPAGCKLISGKDAWRLYDTFGFPVDLTRLMADEKGMSIDEGSFDQQQALAKELSRQRKDKQGTKLITLDVHAINEAEVRGYTKTADSFKYSSPTLENVKVIALYDPDVKGGWIDQADEGSIVGLLLDKTNFYAESGGQDYDTGTISIDEEMEFQVENVQVYAGFILHTGLVRQGKIEMGAQVSCSFDTLRRWPLRNNHTATHMLNHALRSHLGDGFDQKGSLVAVNKLRFDYSAKSPLTVNNLKAIEKHVATAIQLSSKVFAKEVPLSIAKQIFGLRAVFGEVYPDPVRVVSIGVSVDDLVKEPSNANWMNHSIELCGGTHSVTTAELSAFVIMEESAIAKGVRRMIAITGAEAIATQNECQLFLNQLSARLDSVKDHHVTLGNVIKQAAKDIEDGYYSAVTKMSARDILNVHKKRFDELDKAQKAAQASAVITSITEFFKQDNAPTYMVKLLDEGVNSKTVQAALSAVKSMPGKAALLLSKDNGKVSYAAYVDPVLIQSHGMSALQWVDVVAKQVDGKLGGRDEVAQGAGTKVDAVEGAVQLADDFAKLKLKL